MNKKILSFQINDRKRIRQFNHLNIQNIIQSVAHFQKPEILIVEDEPMNQLLMSCLLEKMGFRVVITENGKKGVELFSRDYYEFIFMDLNMPEMNGLEASRFIRQVAFQRNRVQPQIYAWTSENIHEYAFETKKAGMNGIITKAFEPNSVARVIYAWLTQRHTNRVANFSQKTTFYQSNLSAI